MNSPRSNVEQRLELFNTSDYVRGFKRMTENGWKAVSISGAQRGSGDPMVWILFEREILTYSNNEI